MGEWLDDKMHGKGAFVQASGEFTYGEWQDGVKVRDIEEEEVQEVMKALEKKECL